MTQIKDFYQQKAVEFGDEEASEDHQEPEFIISSLESMIGSRPVHMPGYPESVPESDNLRTLFHVSFLVAGGIGLCV
jgi:hypothetical protein